MVKGPRNVHINVVNIDAEFLTSTLRVIAYACVTSMIIYLLYGYCRKHDKDQFTDTPHQTPFNIIDIIIGICLIWFFSASTLITPEKAQTSSHIVYSIIFQFIFALVLLALIIGRYAYRKELRYITLKPLSWKNLVLYPLSGLLAAMLITILFQPIITILNDIMGDNSEQEVVREIQTQSNQTIKWSLSFLAVIVAPIYEEITFRGYLYPLVKSYTNKWFAAITSAIFFGLIHNNVIAFIMLCVLGGILVFVYEKTKSILPCIIIHFLFNLLTVITLHSLS